MLTSGLDRLAEQDWDAYLHALAGFGTAPDVEASVRRLKQAGTQRDHLIMTRVLNQSNIEAWLPRLTMPTLVLHPRHSVTLAPEEAMKLAAAIPNAQLVLVDGASPLGDPQQGLEAVERFLAGIPSDVPMSTALPTSVDLGGLSPREIEVVRLLAAGKSNAQIADELVISQNTVIRHVSNIFAKIGAANRAQAAVYARDHGIA